MSSFVSANNVSTTLASAIGSSTTVLTVATGTGSLFPAFTSPQFLWATLQDPTTPSTREVIMVTAISGDTLTVVRGQDGFSATSFGVGAIIEMRDNAGKWNMTPQFGTANTFTGTNTFSAAVTMQGNAMVDGTLALPNLSAGVASPIGVDSSGNVVTAVAFLTGMGMEYWGASAPTGWVFADGRTIGNASSGATNRANADTVNLYTLLWNTYSNTICPVSSGRGASAAADFAANKTITLLDKRGRVSAAADNMGGTAANRLTTAGAGVDGTTIGSSGGAQTVTLAQGNIPSYTLTGSGSGTFTAPNSTNCGSGAGINQPSLGVGSNTYGGVSVSVSVSSGGSGTAHQNTQPTIVCNYMLKL